MAKTSNLNMRIDPKTKEQAEQLFSNFGITVTEAVNMFLHQSIIYGGIPFKLQVDKPNAETLKAMQEVDEMISGKIPKQTQSIDSLFEDLGI